jgi:hypothetical protein
MSYDYFIARLTRPCPSLKELDSAERLASDDWSADFKCVIGEYFPRVTWSDREYGFFGAVAPADADGRLEFSCGFGEGRFHVTVFGSFHSDQKELLRQIAERLRASLFDIQTGELLHLQKF